MSRRPSALIFDFDGTLVDSMAGHTEIFCRVLAARRGIPPELSREVHLAMAGMGPHYQFVEVLRRAGQYAYDDVDELTREFWRRAEAESPPLFPEVAQTLDSLRSQGYALFVTSGGRTDVVHRRAALLGIDGCFRLMLGTDAGVEGMAKGPRHFRRVAAELGVPDAALAAEAWLIGDGPYDMQVAREAGICAIGRLTGDNGALLRQSGAGALIRDLRELPALLLLESVGRDD